MGEDGDHRGPRTRPVHLRASWRSARRRPHRSITVEADGGGERELEVRYVLRQLEHACAITGHASQSATVDHAIVIGQPEAFRREWAYTALTRTRDTATIHLVSGPDAAAGSERS